MHIPNEERIWATWNHYSISARMQEEGRTNNFKKGMKKKWTGWKLKTEDKTVEFKKRWKRTKVRKTILILVKRTWRLLSTRWFVTRKRKEKKYIMSTPESVRRREEVATRCTANI